jgi:hypothetical protein
MVTMVWVVGRFGLKVGNFIYEEPKFQSIMIELTRHLLVGGDLITLTSQHISS